MTFLSKDNRASLLRMILSSENPLWETFILLLATAFLGPLIIVVGVVYFTVILIVLTLNALLHILDGIIWRNS